MIAPTLDLNAVLTAMADQGLADVAFPPIEQALSELAKETEATGGETEFGDLLLRLARLDRSDVATALLVESGAWMDAAEAYRDRQAREWVHRGCNPAHPGYGPARSAAIAAGLRTRAGGAYGAGCGGLDERVVEYPWLFHRIDEIHPRGGRVLDAGSILNHPEIIGTWRAAAYGPLSIVTLEPEEHAFPSADVRYEYADLRALPYRDGLFDTVLCLSTLEHVGMDNSIYGASEDSAEHPDREAARALEELDRVLAPGGTLLISVPYGEPSRHRWWRIYGREDVETTLSAIPNCIAEVRYFRAFRHGWEEVDAAGADDAGYNDRHLGGRRDAPEWVAAAEAVALIEIKRTRGDREAV